MGSKLVVSDVDEAVLGRLAARAASHGRSIDEEARAIPESAVGGEGAQADRLGERITRRFSALDGVELAVPAREPVRTAARRRTAATGSPLRPHRHLQPTS
jgi:plasmid stability protein